MPAHFLVAELTSVMLFCLASTGSMYLSDIVFCNEVMLIRLPIFEPTCAYARWAHMHRFLSVCPSECHWTKNQTRKKFISQKVLQLRV